MLAERLKLLEDHMKTYQQIYRIQIGSVLAVNVWQPEHAEVSEPSVLNLTHHPESTKAASDPHTPPKGK